MESDDNKPFMLEYQGRVQTSLDLTAKTMLGGIDFQLNPRVFLIGINVDQRTDRPQFCLEPKDCGYSIEWFAEVKNHIPKLFDEDRKNNKKSSSHLSEKAYILAIKSILYANNHPKDEEYYVSYPSYIDGYQVFAVLVLDKEVLHSQYSLSKIKQQSSPLKPLSRSLLESTIRVFLSESTNVLKDPSAESVLPIHQDREVLLQKAEKDLMRTVAFSGADTDGLHRLYELCNEISLMKYEGTVGVGRMIVAKKEHPKINWSLELIKPIRLSNSRIVRKFLELSNANSAIISDAVFIYGLGELDVTYDPAEESVFTIKFLSHMKWELFHDVNSMMVVEYLLPTMQENPIDREKFYRDFPRIFDMITPDQIDVHWEIALEATKQKRGTMLVICDNAESEAVRLGKQGFAVKPFTLTKNRVYQVTSIDGAVLLDRNCQCHAIGVILDGLATEKGNAARGSRYNSAVRYHDHFGKNSSLIIIIVSEDGMIDLIPNLMPQIKHSEIRERIDEFRNILDTDEFRYKPFEWLMNFFELNQFYLSRNECDEINHYRVMIEKRFHDKHLSGVRHTNQDFIPNPEMNDAYYLPE